MHVVAIHDFRRPDNELEDLVAELRSQMIEGYSIAQAIVDKATVPASINASHKAAIRFAQDLLLPEICIMESDVYFPSLNGWRYFLSHKPPADQYDLYLGGTYGPWLQQGDYYEVPFPLGFHCYCVSGRYYERYLSYPDGEHIDSCQEGGVFRLCYPFAAIQRKGWSANLKKKDVDYNTELRRCDVYGW